MKANDHAESSMHYDYECKWIPVAILIFNIVYNGTFLSILLGVMKYKTVQIWLKVNCVMSMRMLCYRLQSFCQHAHKIEKTLGLRLRLGLRFACTLHEHNQQEGTLVYRSISQ